MRNTKGITLIALVITIIVLLIIVGVSINAIFGENGLINNAIWAKFSKEMSELEEKVNIKKTQHSAEILAGENTTPLFIEKVNIQDIPETLKLELLYVRDMMPDDKQPTKEYYPQELIDALLEENGELLNVYYIDENTGGKKETYLYDAQMDICYKKQATEIWGKTIHSYVYGKKLKGITNIFDENQYIITQESEIVEVNGEKFYAPNLKGFNKITTKSIYYGETASQKQELNLTMINGKNELSVGETKYTWYDYTKQTWANIKTTANGLDAYWVWIPRYAYKINYTNSSNMTQGGTNDIIFIDIQDKPANTEKYGDHLPEGYQVHSSFKVEGKEPLKGIWVAKYPPSYQTQLSGSDGVMYTPDMEGFDKENTYLIKYENNKVKSETKLADVKDIATFNEKREWYDYEKKIWANIKTIANGLESYWVWIPRYAYKMAATPNDDIAIIYVDTEGKPMNKRSVWRRITRRVYSTSFI